MLDSGGGGAVMNDYQRLALRTEHTVRSSNPVPERLLHAIIGLASEVGEVGEVLGTQTHLAEELGDCLWYLALAFDSVGEFMGDHVIVNQNRVSVLDSYLHLTLVSSRLCDLIKKALYYQHWPLERDALLALFAEAMSCLAHLATLASTDLPTIGQKNIAKLEARYGK